ncbi:MAG: alpha/beta hydrolase [bacterium]
MSRDEIRSIREMLAAYPWGPETPITTMRTLMDQFSVFFPLPEGVRVEAVDAGGVPAERLRAPGAADDAALLYLHGGGYALGSPTSHRHLAAALSAACSASVLCLQYRLAPEDPFPAAVEDAVRGYQWLLAQAIPAGRIAVAGDSAGGGLTVAAFVALRDQGDRLPAAGICLSPWVDLTCTGGSQESKRYRDPIVSRENLLRYGSLYLGDRDAKTPLASPLFADLAKLPPLLIQVGSDEVLLDDAVRLDRRARDAGVESTLEIWEGMIHVWHAFHPMLEEGREAMARIGSYFRSHMC